MHSSMSSPSLLRMWGGVKQVCHYYIGRVPVSHDITGKLLQQLSVMNFIINLPLGVLFSETFLHIVYAVM